MGEQSRLPGISDGELYGIESRALSEQAQDPRLTEQERAELIAESDQSLTKVAFVAIRDNLMSSRPELELPYLEEGESFHDYYTRLTNLADQYDLEREE